MSTDGAFETTYCFCPDSLESSLFIIVHMTANFVGTEHKFNKQIGVYKGNYNQEHCLSTVFLNISHGGLTKKSECGYVTIPKQTEHGSEVPDWTNYTKAEGFNTSRTWTTHEDQRKQGFITSLVTPLFGALH
jgi:hypothetical protein